MAIDHFAKLKPLQLEAAPGREALATEVFDVYGSLAEKFRLTPFLSAPGKGVKYAARLSDVAPHMHCGDGGWYSGRAFHSWLIRIGEFSDISHAWMVDRRRTREIRILDVVEFKGGEDVSLFEKVEKYPGQYLWAPVNRQSYPDFNGHAAVAAAKELINTPYGTLAVWTNGLTHIDPFRTLIYWLYLKHREDVNNFFTKHPPFCSGAQKLWAIKGGQDPVPDRPTWLTTPADTYESLLWVNPKIALYPG